MAHGIWFAHTHLFSLCVSQCFILFSSHGDRYTVLPLYILKIALFLCLFLRSSNDVWRNVSVLSRFHLSIEKRFTKIVNTNENHSCFVNVYASVLASVGFQWNRFFDAVFLNSRKQVSIKTKRRKCTLKTI